MATIYRIYSDKGDLQYYGSTSQSLKQRWSEHKSRYRNVILKNKDQWACKSREIFNAYGIDNCCIELIEECVPELSKERERYYIENNNCVNTKIPGRIINLKEYREEHKEHLTEISKKWYENNKKKVKEYASANRDHINAVRRKKVELKRQQL
jgi:hypothetical protein